MFWVGNDDYMFRYLTLNSLPFFSRKFSETWKDCFKRNRSINSNFTKEKWKWQGCTIRHFKKDISYVEALDSLYNFVVACDNAG